MSRDGNGSVIRVMYSGMKAFRQTISTIACEVSAHRSCVAALIDAGEWTKRRHIGYVRVATLLHNHSFTLPHPSVISAPISMHHAIG